MELNSVLKEKIRYKLEEIEFGIDKEWRNHREISLMTGLGSVCLFYAQRDIFNQVKNPGKKVELVLEPLFDEINSGNFVFSYCNGLVGAAFLINLLNKYNSIDRNTANDSLSFFDDFILENSKQSFSNFEDIDFLHARMGVVHYFLERNSMSKNVELDFKNLVHNVCEVVCEQVLLTESVRELSSYNDLTHITNFGLAHGHTAVILLLSKYLKKYGEDPIVRRSLEMSINCVISFKSKDDTSTSLFPAMGVNPQLSEYNVPLGWCYGDQTIAFGFSKASEIISTPMIASLAQETAFRTLRRDTFELALSDKSDACFCHGATSLAYLNKLFYKKYRVEKFFHLYEKFTKVALDKGNDKEGIAGYRNFLGFNKYESKIGLLDGVSGIGLFFMDALCNGKDQIDWQSCFLLE